VRSRKLTGLLIAAGGTLLAGNPPAAEQREWIIVPYLWGADTSLDLLVEDDPVFGGALDFADLVDKLDLALQVHVETRKNKFGLLFDLTYLETSDRFVSPANPPLPGGTELVTDGDLTIIEAGMFYRPSGDAWGWDALFGVRAMDVGADLTLTPPSPLTPRELNGSKSLTDGFVGVRYVGELGEKWFVSLRGDAGAGDSDLSWNLVGLLGYRFGNSGKYSLLFGYRHFAVEFDDTRDGLPVGVDLSMSGPEAGFAFRF